MLQVFWDNMPPLEILADRLEQWGQVIRLGKHSIRLIPEDIAYPAYYFNENGSIDILINGQDLFYQKDCLDALEEWIGEKVECFFG